MSILFSAKGDRGQLITATGSGAVVMVSKTPENAYYDIKLQMLYGTGETGFSADFYDFAAFETKEAALAVYPSAWDMETEPPE